MQGSAACNYAQGLQDASYIHFLFQVRLKCIAMNDPQRPTYPVDKRSVLAYNGEFFPITNAPCLRCIVENASPFSIVFSQLETEWLTIPISFVPFFLPLRSVSFVFFFFSFFSLLYSWKILFYFILYFFYGIGDDIQGYCSNLWMRGSFRNLKLDCKDQWFSLKSRLASIPIDAD